MQKTNTSRGKGLLLIAAIIVCLVALFIGVGWSIHLVYTKPDLQHMKVPAVVWSGLVALFGVASSVLLFWVIRQKEVVK